MTSGRWICFILHNLVYIHEIIDTYSGLQWAMALRCEMDDYVIIHSLEIVATIIQAVIEIANSTLKNMFIKLKGRV